MKRIVGFLLLMVLLMGVICVYGAPEGHVSASISIDEIKQQTQLMNATQISGTVTIMNQSGDKLPGVVMLGAFQNNQMQSSQIITTGAIPRGKKQIAFSMDKLDQVDSIQVFVLSAGTLEPYCPPVKDTLTPAQVILFQFDGVRPAALSQMSLFDKAISYFTEQGVPVAAGISGMGLVEARTNADKCQDQIAAVRQWISDGHQLWISGYDDSRVEFAAFGANQAADYDKQKDLIGATCDLIESIFHYQATCFSAPYQQNNEDTITALNEEFPQIKTVLFANDPNKRLKAMNVSNRCNMENGAGAVSYQAFLTHYELVKTQPYLMIQGRPGLWDDKSMDELAAIVTYLKQQNCVFMTPEQYRLFTGQ